jgi:uncharacterized protein YaaR (DUF327 family)
VKVNKVTKSSAGPTKVNKPQVITGTSFSDLMGDKRESDTKEELQKLMVAIRAEGDKLVDAKNIEVLVHYKKMVKDFVSRAVDFAFEIQDRKGLSRFGRSKVLKVVSQIDQSLVDLTQEFLVEERNRIKLLSKIGELQGMLLNIYA